MLRMTVNQEAVVTITVRDRRGNPARLDGVPQWASSDPNVITVTPAADGMSARVSATGNTGTGLVTVTGDADLGEGTRPLIGTLDCAIVGEEAVVIEVTAGVPTDKPVA